MKLKKEFTFNYNSQEIQVKLIGEVYCAIFGQIAKPLTIENNKIHLREGKKLLADLPEGAKALEHLDILKQIKELLKDI
jgi:hypothetical protein